MPLLYVIGGLVSIGLLVYLVIALLKPELFA
jgi:K+-transporting ATPase KdpF subunit